MTPANLYFANLETDHDRVTRLGTMQTFFEPWLDLKLNTFLNPVPTSPSDRSPSAPLSAHSNLTGQ